MRALWRGKVLVGRIRFEVGFRLGKKNLREIRVRAQVQGLRGLGFGWGFD